MHACLPSNARKAHSRVYAFAVSFCLPRFTTDFTSLQEHGDLAENVNAAAQLRSFGMKRRRKCVSCR